MEFSKEIAQVYDERNRKLAPISENMHFLIRLILEDVPADARILCSGVGTGAEVLSLAQAHPGWTFFGLDPSSAMLDVARQRLRTAGFLDRCELFHGPVEEAPAGECFDAALSILVGHFIRREDRSGYLNNMISRLKPGGCLVNTEVSFDLESAAFAPMIENWKKVQALMGVPPESLANLPETMRQALTVLAPAEVEDLLVNSGVKPVRFFQAFMITGWYGVKA